MRIGSLCSGYGGLEMGVQAVLGGTTAWVSDIDKGACKILAHRFPGVPNIGDMTAVDWSAVEPVDLICGGTPCQDLSHAGKRAGMTAGTRSNLWVAMREAIAVIRPRYVVWENVRGAYSAAADSQPQAPVITRRKRGKRAVRSVVHGDGLLALPDGGPSLRALGRVLGDLSDLGYDCRWHGLRAADVGAPHGRFRVFVVATDAERGGRDGWSPVAGWGEVGRAAAQGSGEGALLPTPVADNSRGLPSSGTDYASLPNAVCALLPSPRATDGTKGGPNQRGSSGDLMLPSAVTHLLPTPAVNDMGASYTPEEWDAWTARMKAEHGNGNGHGASLSIEAQRLLPTPTVGDSKSARNSTATRHKLPPTGIHDGDTLIDAIDKIGDPCAVPAQEGPREDLSDVRDASDPQEVRQRPTRGQDGLPQADALLTEVREQPARGSARQSQVEGSADHVEGPVPGLRDQRAPARTSPRPEPGEQRPHQPLGAVCLMPSDSSLAGGLRGPCGCGTNWGQYEAAVRRWERILGRCAPPPTELGPKGRPRLDARFSEFMMGLPAGWVTDTPDITRNEALRAIGNGVCPQQCAAALTEMLAWQVAA